MFNKVYVKEHINRKIPKYLNVIFLISQFLCGMNYGYAWFVGKDNRVLAKLFSYFISLVNCLIFVAWFYQEPSSSWNVLTIAQYFSYAFPMHIIKYNLYNFLYDVKDMCKLKDSNARFLKLALLMYYFYVFLIKTTCYVAYYMDLEASTEKYIIFVVIHLINCLGPDSAFLALITIYFYLKINVRNLKDILQISATNVNLVKCQYIKLATCYEKISNLTSLLVVLQLVFAVPKLLLLLWYLQVDIKKMISWYQISTQLITFLQYVIQIMYPAVFAELLSSEVAGLKLVLNEHLREEATADENTKLGLKRLIRYVKVRPLNQLVLRFIPIGLNQVLSIFSFCTTYIIVIIQFTHIYD